MDTINVKSLLANPGSEEPFHIIYPDEQLGLSGECYQVIQKAVADGVISSVSEDELLLKAKLGTTVLMPCSRCLKETEVCVNLDFSERLVTEERYEELASLEALGTASGELPEPLESDYFNLSGFLLEELELAFPFQPLCKEDCKGLCPNCGADLNDETCTCNTKQTDPRWNALSAFLEDE